MFNRRPRNRDAEKIAALESENAQLRTELTTLRTHVMNMPVLVGIKAAGRLLRFTFVKGGVSYQIETYSTMSDDVEAWKRDLLQ